MPRAWDAFLTAQDRLVDAGRSRGRFGFGERPALLLVDLYRAVFGDVPVALPEAMQEWPSSCGPGRGCAARPRIVRTWPPAGCA
jgi:hypothetical protein